jgi:hypothetical protein
VTELSCITLLVSIFVAVGLGAVRALGLPLTRAWSATSIGLAPLVGMLACGVVGTVTAALGVGVRLELVAPLTAALVGIALILRRGHSAHLWTRRVQPRMRLWRAIEVGLLATVAVVGIAIIRLFAVSSSGWDGWAIWELHAHAIYTDGTTTGPVFTSPVYAGGHPEYPILFPTLEALFAQAIGRFDPTLILVLPALMLVFVALALWAVLRTVIPPALAAASAVALLGTPGIVDNFRGNYADGALATVTALGAVCLLIWVISGSSVALALASALLACSGLIKAEGVLFAGAAVLAALIAAFGERRGLRPLAVATTAIVAPACSWFVLVRLRGVQQSSYHFASLADPGYLEANGFRFTRAALAMLRDGRAWNFSAALLIAATLMAVLARRAWPIIFVLAWLSISFVGLAISYLVSTVPIEWHLATSSARVIFTLAVGAAALAPVVAIDAWDRLNPLANLRTGDVHASGSSVPPPVTNSRSQRPY